MINNVFAIAVIGIIQFVFITRPAAAEPTDWQVKIEQQDLEISTRQVAHSDYLEVQAKVTFQASFNIVKQFFTAEETCWAWQLRCSQTNIIASASESKKTIYVVVDMPWPIDDRDFVFNSTLSEDQANKQFTLALTPASTEALPTAKTSNDLVRAFSTITYTLKGQSTDNTSTLNVNMHTEFGGSTPSSLTNSLLHQELKKDLTKLMQLVKSAKETAEQNAKG